MSRVHCLCLCIVMNFWSQLFIIRLFSKNVCGGGGGWKYHKKKPQVSCTPTPSPGFYVSPPPSLHPQLVAKANLCARVFSSTFPAVCVSLFVTHGVPLIGHPGTPIPSSTQDTPQTGPEQQLTVRLGPPPGDLCVYLISWGPFGSCFKVHHPSTSNYVFPSRFPCVGLFSLECLLHLHGGCFQRTDPPFAKGNPVTHTGRPPRSLSSGASGGGGRMAPHRPPVLAPAAHGPHHGRPGGPPSR